MATLTIDPVCRIEGHLKVWVQVDTAGGAAGTVTDIQLQSKLFRGLENIMKRRDPRDAPVIAQRI